MSALKWTNIGATSVLNHMRWPFYAYDRIRESICGARLGERKSASWSVLLSLLSAFRGRGMDDGMGLLRCMNHA
ncbi:IS1 family transposase [Shigella flexneri]